MKTFIRIDYWVQTLLLVLMGVTIPTVMIPLILLLGFGGWQLFSGLVTAIFYKKLNRKAYFPKSLAYILFLYLGSELPFLNDFGGLGYFLFGFIIPFAIGVWYYVMVSKDYHYFCQKKITQPNTMEMNSPFEREQHLVVEAEV